MLKKVGKIIIVFIVTFLIGVGVVLGLFIDAFIDIELGEPYGWEVNQRLSNNTITWLEGNINITYPSNNPFTSVIPDHCKGFLKFKDIDIGEITFKNPGDDIWLDNIEGLKRGDTKTYKLYLGIFNYQLPIIWYNYFNDGENGTITLDMAFYFRIINLDFIFRVPHTAFSVNLSPITNRINEEIINSSITKTINLTSWRKLQISKEKESTIITFVPDFLLKFRRNLMKSTMELTDDIYLEENQNHFTIFRQNFTWYSRNSIIWFLKSFGFKPHHFKIYGNDVEIGEITFVSDKNLPLEGGLIHKIFWKKTACFMNVKIFDMMLDDCFRSIVKNYEYLTLNFFFVHNGKIEKRVLLCENTIYIDIAGFFNNIAKSMKSKSHEERIDYPSEFNKNMQLLMIVLAYVLSAWVFADAIWEKYRKQQ